MGGRWCSLSIGIAMWVEYSDVDGLLHASGGLVIFSVEDLYTLHEDLVACRSCDTI